MNLEIILNILSVSITSGIISTQTIQYIKDKLKLNNVILFGIVSFIIGSLFAISFTNFNFKEVLWCGFVSVIGAENLYKTFEGKFGLQSTKK